MRPIKDKIVLVTGAAQGLGQAIGEVLGCKGACVLLSDIKSEQAKAAAEQLKKQGLKAEGLYLDVTDDQGCKEAVEKVVMQYGRLDVLINNAGIDFTKSVEELSISEWDKVVRVNLCGPFLLSKLVFPLMRQQGGGQIVNIASTAAKRTWPNAAAYHASKWGLVGFSHALHTEGRPFNIKVTAVIAGGMKTPFILDRFPEAEANLQDPKSVAETVNFVLSLPAESAIPEVMVVPMRETSWP